VDDHQFGYITEMKAKEEKKKRKQPDIYLWSKVSLFCFCHSEISQTTTAHHVALLVSWESSRWLGVHRLGLRLFGATVWKLLIIESFSQWKLNKIKIENYIGIWGHSCCC
jgi:hypothetical protein